MAIKTVATKLSISAFINTITDKERQSESRKIVKLMQKVTGEKPTVWSNDMIGFGTYHYQSEKSKQEGYWPLVAFAPRATNHTFYIMPGFEKYAALMKKLGKYKTGSSCLYVKKLKDVDVSVLEELIGRSVVDMRKKHKV